MLLPHMVVKGKVGSIPVQFYCRSLHIKSIEIACGISDVWAGSMYWLSSKLSEQIWYELYALPFSCQDNCFAFTRTMANMQLLLSTALHFMLILLSLLAPGVHNYTYTGTKQDIDPVGITITTSHDVVVRHFGLEKLHTFLVPGRCPDTDYRCRK